MYENLCPKINSPTFFVLNVVPFPKEDEISPFPEKERNPIEKVRIDSASSFEEHISEKVQKNKYDHGSYTS